MTELEATFGDLHPDYAMPFAVHDFFRNGGSHAVVVRLFEGDVDASTATITAGNLTLVASSPGSWADGLRARVNHDTSAGGRSRRLPSASRSTICST